MVTPIIATVPAMMCIAFIFFRFMLEKKMTDSATEDFQTLPVRALRHVIRKLRRRAILFNCHHFNTRRTKQDLVRLLDSLFFRVRETEQGAVHLHHRRLVFDLWLKDDDFFLDSDCSQPV